MHRIILNEDLNLEKVGISMKQGIPYYVDSKMVAELAFACDGNFAVAMETFPDKHSESFSGNSHLVIIRSGGAGDLLFLTPTLRALRLKFPELNIAVACMPQYGWVLRNNPHINGLLPFPMLLEHLAATWVVNLENVIEDNHKIHAVDLMAARCGLGEMTDKKTEYIPSLNNAVQGLPKRGKRIAVQWSASSAIRSYPHMNALLKLLCYEGYQIIIYTEDTKFQVPERFRKQVFIPSVAGWSWEQSINYLPTCDAAIGPDSSMIHFAGAMKIPAIGLYGSFDWRQRTLYQASIHPIEAVGSCAPCYHHQKRASSFPIYCPTQDKGICGILAKIEPDQVLETLKGIL